MDNQIKFRNAKRIKRALRVRKHVRGTSDKPRFSVFKSNKHLSVQIIDDESGKTLVSYGSLAEEFSKQKSSTKSKETAKQIGKIIAGLARKNNIERVVFDRGRYKFHGVIAELANAARENGLVF